jgi:hypothetical protein
MPATVHAKEAIYRPQQPCMGHVIQRPEHPAVDTEASEALLKWLAETRQVISCCAFQSTTQTAHTCCTLQHFAGTRQSSSSYTGHTSLCMHVCQIPTSQLYALETVLLVLETVVEGSWLKLFTSALACVKRCYGTARSTSTRQISDMHCSALWRTQSSCYAR